MPCQGSKQKKKFKIKIRKSKSSTKIGYNYEPKASAMRITEEGFPWCELAVKDDFFR